MAFAHRAADIDTCRKCGAKITFAENGRGRMVPLDLEPVPKPEGRWLIDRSGYLREVPDAVPDGRTLHADTCAGRKRRRG